MAHREKDPKGWRADPEATSASGGHLPPEVDTAGPLFDPLFDPIPAQDDAEARRNAWVAEGAVDGAVTEPTPFPRQPPEGPARPRKVGRPARPPIRRIKRTLKRVSPFTVFKLSLFYYTLFLFVWLGLVAVLYWALESTGFFEAFEEVSEVFSIWGNVDLTLGLFERYALIIGVILVVVGSLINAFLAFLYNLGSDLFGGIEMTFVERDL